MDFRKKLFQHAAVRERLQRQTRSDYRGRLASRIRGEIERRMQGEAISIDQLLDLSAELAVKFQFAKRNSKTLWDDLVLAVAIYSDELSDTRLRYDTMESTLPRDARRQVAMQGALAKIERDADGKQAAKRGAKEMWARWECNELHYPSIAAFARDVIKNFPAIQNPKSIENWVREWRGGRDVE